MISRREIRHSGHEKGEEAGGENRARSGRKTDSNIKISEYSKMPKLFQLQGVEGSLGSNNYVSYLEEESGSELSFSICNFAKTI